MGVFNAILRGVGLKKKRVVSSYAVMELPECSYDVETSHAFNDGLFYRSEPVDDIPSENRDIYIEKHNTNNVHSNSGSMNNRSMTFNVKVNICIRKHITIIPTQITTICMNQQ